MGTTGVRYEPSSVQARMPRRTLDGARGYRRAIQDARSGYLVSVQIRNGPRAFLCTPGAGKDRQGRACRSFRRPHTAASSTSPCRSPCSYNPRAHTSLSPSVTSVPRCTHVGCAPDSGREVRLVTSEHAVDSGPQWHYRLSFSICSAWRRLVSVTVAPESMRAISTVRSASFICRT